MKKTIFLCAVAGGLMLASPSYATVGVAEIKGTKEDLPVKGRLRILEKADGIEVEATITEAPPGKHGFHFHQVGQCDDEGKAAGDHFNPEHTQHGYLPKDGRTGAHAGDMGNITIDEHGKGFLEVFMPGVYLSKTPSVGGLSVILHEKEDDFGQPTGNAGARIGCGVIELKDNIEQIPDAEEEEKPESESTPPANTSVPPETEHNDPSHQMELPK